MLRKEGAAAHNGAVKPYSAEVRPIIARGLGVILMLLMVLVGTVVFSPAEASAAPTWPGTHWTKLSPSTSPSPRYNAEMAYDPATGQMILYGGDACPAAGPSMSCSDTWDWNGTTWSELFPPSYPVQLTGSLAYDGATRQLVLFGQYPISGEEASATWVWTGATWTEIPALPGHPEPGGSAMAYDQTTRQLLLFGATNAYGYETYGNQTWAWDGSEWTQLAPATSPAVRIGESMAFDPATNQLLLFGGV